MRYSASRQLSLGFGGLRANVNKLVSPVNYFKPVVALETNVIN